MGLLDKNWLSSPPHDYELKRYMLLDAIQHIKKMIKNGELYTALNEVEDRLQRLYRFYGEKGKLEDEMKILKGINLDTMSLEYEYPEDLGEMNDIYEVCDLAIDEFESVFKLIRSMWRKYSESINITEVPEKRPTKERGYVFISKRDSNNNILVYQHSQIVSNTDWKTLDLIPITELEKKEGVMSSFIQELENSDNFRFWRIDHSIDSKEFENGLFQVIRYNLFYKIVVS